MEQVNNSIAASVLIGLGCVVLLKAPTPIGAFLFAFGLLCVCIKGYDLFTGKCGYIALKPKQERKEYGVALLCMLAYNFITSWFFGLLVGLGDKELKYKAIAKIGGWSNNIYSIFVSAVLCGAIMYLAVSIYKSQFRIIGIVFGVPLFILSGMHHCIANTTFMG